MLLLGGGAGLPELTEVLASAPQIQVLRAAPQDLLECGEAIVARSDNTALTVAVGLAMFRGE